MDNVTDLQMSPDGTYFITSSKDKSAKVGQPRLRVTMRDNSRLIARCCRSGLSDRTRTSTATRTT